MAALQAASCPASWTVVHPSGCGGGGRGVVNQSASCVNILEPLILLDAQGISQRGQRQVSGGRPETPELPQQPHEGYDRPRQSQEPGDEKDKPHPRIEWLRIFRCLIQE